MRTRGNGVGVAGGGRLQDLRRSGRQSAARQRRIITAGNGRLVAAPTFVDGHGGHPERDVEGAVPYKGAVEMVR